MTRQAIVAANWKMNGSLDLVGQMSTALNELTIAENTKVVVCVPAPYLAAANVAFTHDAIGTGAQNLNENESGAFTGELSTSMLREFGAEYVIIGHSERRSIYGEGDALIAAKVDAALKAGLTPLFCVGESESERENNETEAVLESQIKPVLDLVGVEAFKNVVIAYEPVWAIGTGKTASPEMAQETHAFIRKYLAEADADMAAKVPLLYGGSMNAGNCENLLAQADIDGGLVGGASLKPEDFSVICKAAKGSI